MIKKLIFAALVSSSVLFAQELVFSGKLQSHYAAGLRGKNAGDCIKGGFVAEGEIKGSLLRMFFVVNILHKPSLSKQVNILPFFYSITLLFLQSSGIYFKYQEKRNVSP